MASFENFREHLVAFGIAPLMTGTLGYLWCYALQNPRIIPGVLILSIAPYPLAEQGIRGVYHFWPRFSSEEKWIESKLAKFQRNRWWYDSQDYVIDRDAFRKPWAMGEMTLESMIGNFTNLLAPRITKPKGDSGYVPRPTVFIQFDRLFTSDPITGKPVYAVFIRVSDRRPSYPKPATQRSYIPSGIGQLVLQPNGSK